MSYILDGIHTAMGFEPWNEIHCSCGWWINRGDKNSIVTLRFHYICCPQARISPKETDDDGIPTCEERVVHFQRMLRGSHEDYRYVQPRMIRYRKTLEEIIPLTDVPYGMDNIDALVKIRGIATTVLKEPKSPRSPQPPPY